MEFEKIRCKNLRCEDGRWFWNIGDHSYYTDTVGDGIWEDDKQITGTCQFSLTGMSVSGARKKINRWFN